jgi:hypothetical protein
MSHEEGRRAKQRVRACVRVCVCSLHPILHFSFPPPLPSPSSITDVVQSCRTLNTKSTSNSGRMVPLLAPQLTRTARS